MKYCQKCGKQLDDEAVICISCGCSTGCAPAPCPQNNRNTVKYCQKCGKQIHAEAVICIGCGCSAAPLPSVGAQHGANAVKYCQKCGHQLNDEAIICVGCGCSTGYQPAAAQLYGGPGAPKNNSNIVNTAPKTFWQAVGKCYSVFGSCKGRANRKEFWSFYIYLVLLNISILFVAGVMCDIL